MSIDTSRIQALCFDIDGTLRDTDDQYAQQIAATLRPVGWLFKTANTDKFARWIVMAIEDPGNEIQGLSDRLNLDHHLSHLMDAIGRLRPVKRLVPPLIIPGVEEMLGCLSNRYPLAIVSARGERSTHAFLEQTQLNQYFQVIVTGQSCVHTKPYPDPILFACQQMGVPPENCLMVGDTTVDIRAGRLAGCQTVGVLCGFGEEKELRSEGADLILSSTPLLLPYLIPESS